MNAQDGEGETDSLFGSPPPSPTRGRSPALALPGSLCAPCPILPELPKNVGTIALPGSHNCSELPVRLPASSRVHSAQSAVPGARQYRFAEWIGPRATSLPANTSCGSKQRKRKKPKSVAPELSTNDSTLASNNAPVPHCLRNRQALLGLASVINATNACCRDTRGSNEQNPIIVDEEEPPVGTTSRNAPPSQAFTAANTPDSQSIADALISQGNIFPVLRSLMPYYGLGSNGRCCSGQVSQQSRSHGQVQSNPNITAPPLKRRKLNSVPAGAKDWDVPYPFPANEGPPNYLESWKKKRGKKLMMQLVSLVREAVQKASAKSRTQEGNTAEKVEEPTLTGPQPFSIVRSDVQSEEPTPSQSDTDITASSVVPAFEPTSFPDFFTSSGFDVDPEPDFNSDFDALLSAVNNALSDPNVQLAGDDLATMSSYPFSPTVSSSPTLTSSTRLSTPCDIRQLETSDGKENEKFDILDFRFDDLPIDPSLLDSTWPGLTIPASQSAETCLSVPASLEDNSQVDPGQEKTESATHDEIVNEFSIDPVDNTNEATTCLSSDGDNPQTPTPATATTTQPTLPVSFDEAMPPASQTQTPTMPMEIQFTLPIVGQNFSDCPKSGCTPSTKRLNKQDVLRRARVRREQLAAEVARAKIELWETTIEQGVLTHLSKDKELRPKA